MTAINRSIVFQHGRTQGVCEGGVRIAGPVENIDTVEAVFDVTGYAGPENITVYNNINRDEAREIVAALNDIFALTTDEPELLNLDDDFDVVDDKPSADIEGEEFDVVDILSVTTGILLCDIGNLYRILSYLTGQPLMTHQLPAAGDAVRDRILDLYPWLATIELPDFEGVADPERLARLFSEDMAYTYGRLPLPEMHDAYTTGPITAMIDIMGKGRRDDA